MTKLLSASEEQELGREIQKMLKFKELQEFKEKVKSGEKLSLDEKQQEKMLLKDLNNGKKLTKIQGDKILEEGLNAVNMMVDKNLGLVHNAARKYRSHYGKMEYDDIVQYGMVGLMNAIYKFDPSRENKFSTLATWWIFQSINRNVNKYSRSVRLPENKIIQYGNMLEIQNRYEEDSTISRGEINEIVMDELKISEDVLKTIQNTMIMPASLNKVVGSDDGKELIEFLDENNDEIRNDVEDFVVKEELLHILENILSDLDKKEQDVLTSSFALDLVSDPLKPAEVREKYGLTRARYNTVLNKALDKVKKELEDRGLSFTDFV